MISKDIYEKVCDITYTDYEFELKNDNYIVNIDTVESLIEDLLSEIEHLNEKYKDLEQDIEDNYRPIPYEEQVCVSDRDFI